MRVAIHAVDGHGYPNLALMRISAWHKAMGDTVEWFSPLCRYDRVYASKIFSFTPDDPYLPDDAVRGGTGYGRPYADLPPEIEATPPDYTIYPQFGEAYGFLTRGCPNRCPWCVVPVKEGGLRIYSDIQTVCRTNTGFRKRAVLMDNNFLAAPTGFIAGQVAAMRNLGVRVDFNQGLDARRVDDGVARLLADVPWIRYVRISCDTDAMVPHVLKAVSLMRGCRYGREVFVYVLAKEVDNTLARILRLTHADPGIVPFVMPYREIGMADSDVSPEMRRLARWCNRAWIRKQCKFEEFDESSIAA